jgi:protein TIF31
MAKDYDFSSQKIFELSDIVNIYPIVKHSEPRINLADQIFQHGADLFSKATTVADKVSEEPEEVAKEKELRQANLTQGLELMKEAITILEQVRGPIHSHTARALSHLAVLLGKTANLKEAIFFQKKAVIAYERCYGIDDPGTLQQYVRNVSW